MTESMIVEAVRAAGGPGMAQTVQAVQPTQGVQAADPAAVARFNAAMDATPIPFADEASHVWRAAQENNQGLLHRIRALAQLDRKGGVAGPELVELQYEVMNLSFQHEIVTKVADKSSSAIQTLVKNQ